MEAGTFQPNTTAALGLYEGCKSVYGPEAMGGKLERGEAPGLIILGAQKAGTTSFSMGAASFSSSETLPRPARKRSAGSHGAAAGWQSRPPCRTTAPQLPPWAI